MRCKCVKIRSQLDGFVQETATSLSSGAQNCFTGNQTESENPLQGENFVHIASKELKTSTTKEKGTPSILKFFQSHTSCLSLKQEHANSALEAMVWHHLPQMLKW